MMPRTGWAVGEGCLRPPVSIIIIAEELLVGIVVWLLPDVVLILVVNLRGPNPYLSHI